MAVKLDSHKLNGLEQTDDLTKSGYSELEVVELLVNCNATGATKVSLCNPYHISDWVMVKFPVDEKSDSISCH